MALSDRQSQMGHGDVRMTMHYTHSDLERRRAAIETMTDRLMGEVAVVLALNDTKPWAADLQAVEKW